MKAKVNDALKTPNELILGSSVTHADICSLSGNNWLDDKVINCYSEMITKRSIKNLDMIQVKCFTTHFFAWLSKGYDHIRKWTKDIDIFGYRKLIFPIHLPNHWVCAVINFVDKRIEYYDSYHGQNEDCLKVFP